MIAAKTPAIINPVFLSNKIFSPTLCAASTPTAPGPATADAAGSPAASAEDPGPRADGGLAERAARTPVVAEPQVPGAASASASAGEARRELSQPALPTASLPHAPGSSRWADGLGERVAWMLDTRNHVAELRLTPPELGRLDVRIAVSGSEASIQFSAPSAAVREAVDAALPRLREMLEADGLSLAHADVSDHGQDTAGRRAAPEDGPAPRSGTGGEGGDAADPHAVTLVPLARAGLIDHYA